MYANNLSQEELEEMQRQSNIKEAINFIKLKFPSLENINENMHRKELEQEINNLFIYEILKLVRYLTKTEKEILMQFLSKYEINCVKNVFRNVTTNRDSKVYLKNIDNWTTKIFKNINGINQITEETEFLELIKSEDYYKVFSEYEEVIENVPLDEIEVKLDKYYFEKIYKLAKKVNRNLLFLIGTEIDLLNVIWIYRAKKYFGYSPEETKEILIPINYKISKKLQKELLNCIDFNEIKTVLENTVYKNVFLDENEIEYEKNKYLYNINRKIFRTKLFDISTVFAIINLTDVEIKNMINIIEGIRYKIDRNEIQKKIII
jgi:V/A-type H+-transporting ATPase subunit C